MFEMMFGKSRVIDYRNRNKALLIKRTINAVTGICGLQ